MGPPTFDSEPYQPTETCLLPWKQSSCKCGTTALEKVQQSCDGTRMHGQVLARPCNMWSIPDLTVKTYSQFAESQVVALSADVGHCLGTIPYYHPNRAPVPCHLSGAKNEWSGQVENLCPLADPADASVFRWMMEKTWGDWTGGPKCCFVYSPWLKKTLI